MIRLCNVRWPYGPYGQIDMIQLHSESIYETSDFFYSVITFSYTKCFVHSYTVDVKTSYTCLWELVCKFGVIFHMFIISCLCSRFHVRNQWFFYSVIIFSYTKCFVHSYTVDVVFTLSYWSHQCVTTVFAGWSFRTVWNITHLSKCLFNPLMTSDEYI